MGVYQSIHLGPYLVVKNKLVQSTKIERYCDNATCSRHKKSTKSKFCSECGAIIVEINFPIEENYSASQLINDLEYYDDLVDIHNGGSKIFEGREILISNHYGCPSSFDISNNGASVTNLQNIDIQADFDWFNKEFKKQIEALTNEFGPENISLEWGLVIDYN